MKFHLMTHKPKLDTETLNYIWDVLWRFNYTTKGKNQDERSRKRERERIMDLLEEIATMQEEEKNEN